MIHLNKVLRERNMANKIKADTLALNIQIKFIWTNTIKNYLQQKRMILHQKNLNNLHTLFPKTIIYLSDRK